MPLTYVESVRFLLRDEQLNERWLQDRIAESPAMLGLPGDPVLLDRERRQERAGRLDLLLHDYDSARRFEVELMLGATDESHIVRCIEYWDVERRRYPAYEHVAVLVAEDVTARFLNVLGILAGSIPLIVLQLQAVRIEDKLTMSFVKVLDQTSLRQDDAAEEAGPSGTREDWASRVGESALSLIDALLCVVNSVSRIRFALNYRRKHVGLTDGARNTAFIYFLPKKKFVHVKVTVQETAAWWHGAPSSKQPVWPLAK